MCDTNKSSSGNDALQRLLRHLSETGRVTSVSKKFATINNNHHRVDFAYELLKDANLLPELTRDCKSDELSFNYRKQGNEMFKLKKLGNAVEFYTKSVLYAENNSENLGIGYANRSAVLFEKGMFKECLSDIERAFEHNYPDNLHQKLNIRKEKANQLKTQQKTEKYHTVLPTIPDDLQNPSIECATNAIRINHDKNVGRHIVATRDIKAGEVLAVEKPFCQLLIAKKQNHCHHCLQLCYNLIPCENCTQALFCNETCKRNAEKYHKYECAVLKTTQRLEMDKLKLLPMRIAILSEEKSSKTTRNVYKSDRYEEIHKLIANTDQRSVSDLFARAVTAAILFHLVRKHTEFFNKHSENVFKDIVLLHMQTGPCNFHEITQTTPNEDGVYEQEEIGAGVFAFLSMLNHSCSPNVVRFCYGATIVLRALGSIKKGEQCYDNYGYHHALMTKSDRKKQLNQQYYFDCTCSACQDDYPLYQDLPVLENIEELSSDDIDKLQNGDSCTAKKILNETLTKIESLEVSKPNRNLATMEEVVKQCFSLLGNVERPM